jgi:hypothetical protein
VNTEKELLEAASSYSWQEILENTPFVCIGEMEFPQGMAQKWEVDGYENDVIIVTSDYNDRMFELVDGKMTAGVTKFEFIRVVKFNGNHKAFKNHVQTGLPFVRTILPELREHFRAEIDFHYGDMPVSKRKFFDPLLGQAVEESVRSRESTEESKRLLAIANHRFDKKTPKGVNLADFIEMPLNSQRWLIEGILPVGGNCSVVAAMKTGKSTLVYNFIHSLVFGVPFLGEFPTNNFEGRVGFVNFELTQEQCQDWFLRSPIGASDRVYLWNLRGEANPFRSELAIHEFAQEVREQGIRVLILDPWSSLFVGDTNSNDEVKQFWLMLDAFKTTSGVMELIIPIHAGRDVSKSRGASSLDDHPDSIIHLTRQSDGTRTFRATGRDVDVVEGELEFDKDTLLLFYKGAVTPESKDERTAKILRKLFDTRPRLSASDIYRLSGKGKSDTQAARQLMVHRGEIIEEQIGSSKVYSLSPVYCAPFPKPPGVF